MTESRPMRLALIQFEAELGKPRQEQPSAPAKMIAEAAEAGARFSVKCQSWFSKGYQLERHRPYMG